MLSFPHAAARAGIAYLDLVGKREWYGLLQIAWYQVATGVCKCLCGISTWCRWAHCFVELCARSDFTISRFSIWMQIYCIYSSFANAFPKLEANLFAFRNNIFLTISPPIARWKPTYTFSPSSLGVTDVYMVTLRFLMFPRFLKLRGWTSWWFDRWKDHPSCNALKEKWRTICSWGLGVHVGVEIDSVKKEVIWLDLFFPNSVS